MSLRISSAFLALVMLGGCGAQSAEPGGVAMDCAIGGAADLAPVCSVYEVKAMDEDAYLVIWHPDGGFRRVRHLVADKRVEVLDGAAQATGVTQAADGSVSFAVERDRYLLSAEFLNRRADLQPAPQ